MLGFLGRAVSYINSGLELAKNACWGLMEIVLFSDEPKIGFATKYYISGQIPMLLMTQKTPSFE